MIHDNFYVLVLRVSADYPYLWLIGKHFFYQTIVDDFGLYVTWDNGSLTWGRTCEDHTKVNISEVILFLY